MNVRLLLEFDGTDFHGWQRQPGARTVQGLIAEAAEALFGAPVDPIGAGRTDAGVHALAYVCNFHVDTDLSTQRIAAAMSARLPEDIVILKAEVAPDAFHSRFDATSRRYLYHMTTARTALWRRMFHLTHYDLDREAMAQAAAMLVGEHDFTSFAPADNDRNPVCTILSAEVTQDANLVTFSIEADRFLQHMVRAIVGKLIEIGRRRNAPEHIAAVLRKKDRRAAGPTAPAKGLTFAEVRYPD